MIIEVHVITNARKRELKAESSFLKVKLTSVPREGKANEELVEFLAQSFGVRKADIAIIKGLKEKKKLISVPLSPEEVMAALGSDRRP